MKEAGGVAVTDMGPGERHPGTRAVRRPTTWLRRRRGRWGSSAWLCGCPASAGRRKALDTRRRSSHQQADGGRFGRADAQVDGEVVHGHSGETGGWREVGGQDEV